MKANKLMVPYLRDIDPCSKISPKLSQIVDAGFIKWGECYLLKYFSSSATNELKKMLVDEIGVECFINHVHMADYVSKGFISEAAHFVNDIFEKWNNYFEMKLVCYIELNFCDVSIPEDVTARFHVRRDGEEYCDDTLDSFESSGVLKIESDENIFSCLI